MLRNGFLVALGLALLSACGGKTEEKSTALAAVPEAPVVQDVPIPVTDKTLEDVLALHLSWLGGAEKVGAVRTLRLEGTIVEKGGNRIEVIAEKERPLLYRRRFVGAEGKTSGFDGTTGWMQDGEGATATVRDMPPPIVLSLRRHFSIDDPLVDPAGKGFEASLAGKLTVGGIETYVVDLKMADGQPATFYVETSTGRLVKSVEMLPTGQGPLRAEVTYDDEREAGGVRWPFRQSVETPDNHGGQTLEWRSITVNPELDATIFKMPSGPK